MAETFDKEELLDRVDSDLEFLAETIQMLQCDGPSVMQEIRDALASGDATSLGRAAHALKGIVSNFCSPQTQAIALEVEQMGKSGDLSAAPEAVDILGSRLESLLGELATFVKERT
jgi:two-component system, sensor histidine kinase and response regulator